jgi:hypothetical protein
LLNDGENGMTEDEMRETLRSTMTATVPPPPMSSARVLTGARRARLRRRTAWACAGTVTIIATMLGGAAITHASILPSIGTPPAAQPAAPGTGTDTSTAWPTGPDGKPQQDRTARAGARYDQGVRLLGAVLAALPSGYDSPDTTGDNGGGTQPTRYQQAQFEERVNGTEVWSYQASIAVTDGAGTGHLTVEVHTANNQLPTDPCALVGQFWGMGGVCQVVTVGTVQVGVAVRPTGDGRFDQWAAYRYPDGVVVFVAQGRTFDASRPSLTSLPYTVEQLASLATNAAFHLQ